MDRDSNFVAAVNELADLVIRSAEESAAVHYRVAITGITACGKSTLANALHAALVQRRRRCTRISVDDFHKPRPKRYEKGRESAEGYYYDAYDYALLKRLVLDTLGPGGSGVYVPKAFDLESDAPLEPAPVHATPGEIFLFDASFLLRPELRSSFEYRIYIHTDFKVALERGVERDAEQLGSRETARRLYRTRYHAAQQLYFAEADPSLHAHVILDNNDSASPSFVMISNIDPITSTANESGRRARPRKSIAP